MGITEHANSTALRVGLLGGSFDPVHNAHLALATAALRHLQLDEVQLLPAAQPWQRRPLGASAQHRLAMLELATRELADVNINTLEIQRSGTTYTIDTLRELQAGNNLATYYWILGSDQLVNFCTWHAWEDIIRRVQLAVAVRPGFEPKAPAPLAQALRAANTVLHELPCEPDPLSATDIRNRLAAGHSIDGMTPSAVVDYIRTHHLYQG